MIQTVVAACMASLVMPVLGLAQGLDLAGTSDLEEGPRYTYIEPVWITQDVDDLDASGEGYAIHAGMALDRHWHLFGQYSKTNIGSTGIDAELAAGGLGYAFGVTRNLDLVARTGVGRTKINHQHIDGWLGQALARARLGHGLEVEGGVQYVSFNDDAGGDDTSFLAGVRYSFTDWLSVGVSGSVGSDVTEYGLTLRLATF